MKKTQDNRYRHFNCQWFKDNQKVLLWLLNAPIIRYWFSWTLRIHKCRPFNKRIIDIKPNCYTWDNGKDLTTDFRTHNKFSKRIYFSFKYLWLTLHALDQILRPIPQLNFGFDTLTVYPDPDPETDTVDGSVACNDSGGDYSWSDYVNATGDDFNDFNSDSGIFAMASTEPGAWIQIIRFIALFKTSSLTAGATISSATISLYGVYKDITLTATPDINIYSSNPTSNTALQGSDYSTLGTTAFSSAIAYADWNTAGYNNFSLNASGIANINKIGISKFGARNANYDVANSSPTWSDSGYYEMDFNNADKADTTSDPKLVVTYTTGGATSNQVMSII